jgi:hypothetical protein
MNRILGGAASSALLFGRRMRMGELSGSSTGGGGGLGSVPTPCTESRLTWPDAAGEVECRIPPHRDTSDSTCIVSSSPAENIHRYETVLILEKLRATRRRQAPRPDRRGCPVRRWLARTYGVRPDARSAGCQPSRCSAWPPAWRRENACCPQATRPQRPSVKVAGPVRARVTLSEPGEPWMCPITCPTGLVARAAAVAEAAPA